MKNSIPPYSGKKTRSNTKKNAYFKLGEWGGGRRERTRRNYHFPKITKPKKLFLMAQKKGEKTRRKYIYTFIYYLFRFFNFKKFKECNL
jgi:hypothetical protein